MLQGSLTVVLVADFQEVRDDARAALSPDPTLRILAEASVADALSLVQRTMASVALLLPDASSPQEAIGLCSKIANTCPSTRTLVVDPLCNSEIALVFLRAGAYGIVSVRDPSARMRRAVQDVGRGRLVLPASLSGEIRDLMMHRDEGDDDSREALLTRRETEILKGLGEGLRNNEIATSLGISHRTVETHVRHLMLKLGVTSRTQAVVHAMRSGRF